jgi:large subunit ribosomal protein L30
MRQLESPKLKVTLVRSFAGKNQGQRRVFMSLGLKKLGASKVLPNNNCILGQINKVIQFVRVETVE